MRVCIQIARELANDESAASIVENALILAVMVVAVSVGVTNVRTPIHTFFEDVGGIFEGLIDDGEQQSS